MAARLLAVVLTTNALRQTHHVARLVRLQGGGEVPSLQEGIAQSLQLLDGGDVDGAEALLLDLRRRDPRRGDLPPPLLRAFARVFEARRDAAPEDAGPCDALAALRADAGARAERVAPCVRRRRPALRPMRAPGRRDAAAVACDADAPRSVTRRTGEPRAERDRARAGGRRGRDGRAAVLWPTAAPTRRGARLGSPIASRCLVFPSMLPHKNRRARRRELCGRLPAPERRRCARDRRRRHRTRA